MSISDKFQKLLKNLRTTNNESVTNRYKTITKRLNKDFWGSESEIDHSRYVGSYGRGTAIKGF
ncbi:MAG: nucleotidyltransferase, partial [bacterium]